MKVDFQNIEEGQNGKLFAVLEEDQLPVGQLFYKVDDNNKNLLVDYIYIPRKYWREGGIREQLIAELQSMYPAYSFSMKQNQKQAHLLSEIKTSMPQGIPHVKTGLEIIKRFAENFVPPKASEEKTTIFPEGYWWRVRDLFKDPEFNNFMQEYQINDIGQMERLLRAAVKQGILIKDAAGSHVTNARFNTNFYESDYIYAPYLEKYEELPAVKEKREKWEQERLKFFEELKNRKPPWKENAEEQDVDMLPSAKQKHEEYWTEYFNRASKWIKKEAPARSKAQFRYMQGICNGSIEPPKGMTRAKACEYVEGQKNYKKLPEKKTSYKSGRKEKLRIPFHKNIYTGEPCRCGFYISDQKQSGWKQITASKLDKIIKDDPKVLRTEEGQKVLEWMKNLPERVDDLLPWIVREYKKKRLAPNISNDGIFRGMEIQSDFDNPEDGIRRITEETLSHWADWFNSNSPTRRGVDIMQLTTEQMMEKIQEWNQELAQKMDETEATQDEKGVIYKFPDGWTMRELDPEDCADEGAQMGHCVGTGGYGRAIEQGNIKILSLRDEKNKPHATLEVKSDGSVEQIQGKQNVHPIAPYRKRIRQFMVDPNGFEKAFGRKPTFPGGSRVQDWGEFRGMDGESNYDPSIITIDEEEEFNPEYDENIRQHPYAGQGGYSRNYRPEHYGIYPPEASPDKPVDMANLLAFLPEDLSEQDLQKLLNYARRTDQVDQLAKIMQIQQTRNQDLLIIPSFEDERRGGWRDAFEKMTMTNPNDLNYKEKWNEWLSSIWSEDPKQLAKNLVEVNKINQHWGESGSEDESRATSILKIINQYNSMNQLRSMFNPEEDELSNWSEFDETDFSDYRQRFERGLHKGEGLSQLPTRVDEQQLSLLSRWRRTSKWKKISVDNWDDIENEEHTQEEAKWEGQAAAMYYLLIVPLFKDTLRSDYVTDSLHYLVMAASKTQEFYYDFADGATGDLVDIFAGSEENWVLDEEYLDSFYDGFWEETNKEWKNYIEQLNIDIKKALEKEPIYEAIIKDWHWQGDRAVPRFKELIENFENMGPLIFLSVIDNYYYEIYGEAELMYANYPNFAWIKGELDKQIREVINNADEIIAQGLGASHPDYSADMSKWYAEPVSKREEELLGPEETDQNEARKHRKNIRDKWKVQPGKKLEWATEEDFPKKRWE